MERGGGLEKAKLFQMIVLIMRWFQALRSREMLKSNIFFSLFEGTLLQISLVVTLMTQSLWSFCSRLNISSQFLLCPHSVAEVLMQPPLLTQTAFAKVLTFRSLFNGSQISSIVSSYNMEHILSCPTNPAENSVWGPQHIYLDSFVQNNENPNHALSKEVIPFKSFTVSYNLTHL